MHRLLDVIAGTEITPARLGSAAESAATEEEVEDVAEGGEAPLEGIAHPAAVARRTEGVVLLAPLGIAQDLVGQVNLFEVLGCLGVIVDVRVQLARQLAVGPLDLVLARAARDA